MSRTPPRAPTAGCGFPTKTPRRKRNIILAELLDSIPTKSTCIFSKKKSIFKKSIPAELLNSIPIESTCISMKKKIPA